MEPSSQGEPDCPRCEAPLRVGKSALLEEVSRDRHGTIFRGRTAAANLAVIVELGSKETSATPEQVSAGLRLARTLRHPHLPLVTNVGLYRNRLYVVRKDVKGAPVTEASLSLREGASIVRDAALALEVASERNVIHPDLRPGCLFLNDHRHVFVTGLSYVESAGPSKSPASPYVAPEIRGRKRPDPRATVYSLGAVLYEVATGQPPALDPKTFKLPSQVNPLRNSHILRHVVE